jgi:hypothetical protein
MNQLLQIVDNKLVVDRLRVKNTEGDITHSDRITVMGSAIFADNVKVAKNLEISGTLTVETINAKNIVTDIKTDSSGQLDFVEQSREDLDGKGINFIAGEVVDQLVYKSDGRIYSTLNIDLAKDHAYHINKLPVISFDSLGQSVVNSNLRKVGTLKTLNVAGAVNFGDWAFFNPNHQRLGINTENPSGALTIAENNVELVLSSYKVNVGYVGTYNNADLEIGTDNTARISIKNTGDIDVGNSKYKNAVVRIHGRLEVDEIVNTKGIDNTSSLVIQTRNDNTVYGKGIIWFHNNANRELVYTANPDKIHSSETIDLADGKYFSINNSMVLSRNRLGATVTESSLNSVGTLHSLEVIGETKFKSSVVFGVNRDIVITDNILLGGENALTVTKTGVNVSKSFSVVCDQEQELKIDSYGSIEIGNKNNTNRRVTVYGQMSIGVSNPTADVNFTVNGAVSFDNKKFITGSAKPTSGNFRKGDVCWNTDPKATDYIGWVCVREGSPGEWLPFGAIATQ